MGLTYASITPHNLAMAAARHLTLLSDHRVAELALPAATPAPQEPANDLASLRRRLTRARDLLPAPLAPEDLFPTGLPVVDALLTGGLARGCLTELRGAPSSGRLSLVLALLAAATGRGESVALVDLGDHLDPQASVEAGVDLQRLLWVRPTRLRDALAAAEIALAGAFPLVVLELGTPPLRGKRDEHAWLRLARAARHHRGALLVATPYRLTGSAAAEVLALSRHRGVWLGGGTAPRLLAGLDSRLHREKSRREPEPATAPVAWQSSLAFPVTDSAPAPVPVAASARPAALLPTAGVTTRAARSAAGTSPLPGLRSREPLLPPPARRRRPPQPARHAPPAGRELSPPASRWAEATQPVSASPSARDPVAAPRAVPGWVPLARAALAESLGGAPPPRGRA
jgi:hypothetical protein